MTETQGWLLLTAVLLGVAEYCHHNNPKGWASVFYVLCATAATAMALVPWWWSVLP